MGDFKDALAIIIIGVVLYLFGYLVYITWPIIPATIAFVAGVFIIIFVIAWAFLRLDNMFS